MSGCSSATDSDGCMTSRLDSRLQNAHYVCWTKNKI